MNCKKLRELLIASRHEGVRLEELTPDETVYKAIIVRDFMQAKGVDDVQMGIRAFFAFQRGRLKQLGFLSQEVAAGPVSGTA